MLPGSQTHGAHGEEALAGQQGCRDGAARRRGLLLGRRHLLSAVQDPQRHSAREAPGARILCAKC